MRIIDGQILVRETGIGMAGMTVHFFFVAQENVPLDALDETQWEELYRTGWKGLDLERLGSVATARDGRFLFEYDLDKAIILPRGARAPNLWLIVTGSDLSDSKACPKVLHASCEIRTGAGSKESFLIYIAERNLRQLGLLGGVSPINDQRINTSKLFEQVAAVASFTPDTGGQKFSKFFTQRQKELQDEIVARKTSPIRQSTFSLTVGIESVTDSRLNENTTIQLDDSGQSLVVQQGDGMPRNRLKFSGVYRRPPQEVAKSLPTSSLRIDEETGEFQLVLATVAADLRITDDESRLLSTHRAKTI